MARWSKCVVEVVYYDHTPADVSEGCEVKIDEHEIVVTYTDADGSVHYRGKNDGSGHFELRSYDPKRPGHATLHRFKDGLILEGYWEEDGYKGFWRIYLR